MKRDYHDKVVLLIVFLSTTVAYNMIYLFKKKLV
jgi:hypothetical protein